MDLFLSFQVSRPHPSDNNLLFLFVLGGVTPSELRLIKETVNSHKPGSQVSQLGLISISMQTQHTKQKKAKDEALRNSLWVKGEESRVKYAIKQCLLHKMFNKGHLYYFIGAT